MTATETHRNAVRARWRPDLRGLRGGSASPGKNGSGWSELYGFVPYWRPADWFPVYRVSPAYRGGVLRCPPLCPEGCGSCACGRSGRLITPQLTQSETRCSCELAQTPHIRGRMAHHRALFRCIHSHSPPVGRPHVSSHAHDAHKNDNDPSTPFGCDQPVLEGHASTRRTNPLIQPGRQYEIPAFAPAHYRSKMNDTCPP